MTAAVRQRSFCISLRLFDLFEQLGLFLLELELRDDALVLELSEL